MVVIVEKWGGGDTGEVGRGDEAWKRQGWVRDGQGMCQRGISAGVKHV